MPMHRTLTTLASPVLAATLAAAAGAQCSHFASPSPGGNLRLGDEGMRTVALGFAFPFNGVAYTSITVASNGFVWLGDTATGNDFSPTLAEAATLAPRIMPLWWDLDPSQGGGVYFDTDASSQAAVTWQGVPEYQNPAVVANFELTLRSSGRISFHYDTSNGSPTTATVVGISGGGASNVLVTTNWLTDYTGATNITANGGTPAATALQAFGAGGFNLGNLAGSGLGTTIEVRPTNAPTATRFDALGVPAYPTCPPSTIAIAATSSTAIGIGCPKPRTTIHEAFTATAGDNPFDLAATSLLFARSGDDYTLGVGPGFDANYAAPGRGAILAGVGDDTVTTVSLAPMTFGLGTRTPLTSVQVGSNGYLWLPTGTAEILPDARIVTSGARVAAFWTDLVPDVTAHPIYWEASAAFCQATWQSVPIFGDGGAYTFQIRLFANGNVAISYGAMQGTTTRPQIVGLSGGAATDTGPRDLATGGSVNAMTRQITGAGQTPMTHTVGLPGLLGQDLVLTASVPASNLGVGVFAVGLGNPGLPIDLLFGPGSAPGCSLYSDATQDFFYPVPFPAGSTSFSHTAYAPIPALLYLQGLTAFTQAAAMAPANAAGVITSNGRRFVLGF